MAFAATVAGEAHLLSGDLDRAFAELSEAIDLHRQIGANAGESLSLQRLAEVYVQRGELEEAMPLLEAALPLARWSALSQHLIQRVFGTMIRASADPAMARMMVDRAQGAIGPSDVCVFCTVMVAVPSVIACAKVGDVDDAKRHLAMAERSAMAWQGTAWPAALEEARAHLAEAEGRHDDAHTHLVAAHDLFAQAGQPLDARRCEPGNSVA